MKKYIQIVLIIPFCLGSYLFSYSQIQKSSAYVEQELKNVLEEWVQNANKKDYDAMRNMLTHDYFLFQNGRRYNKDETIRMIRDSRLSDITYTLNNVKSGSGGAIAFLTFDLDWHGKVNVIVPRLL